MKTVFLQIRLEPAEKRALAQAAKADKRTPSAWARLVLLQAAKSKVTQGKE